MPIPLRTVLCCCYSNENIIIDKRLKKRLTEHKYCGCDGGQSIRQRQRVKMKSYDDNRSQMEEQVCEALDYDFSNHTEENVEELYISEPVVPFSHELNYTLHPQSNIVVEGVITENLRFSINLVIGHNECPDIAFHFNPRLDMHYVARNTFLDGQWGVEESSGEHKFPFVNGESFHIEFFLTHSEFMVAINGLHYCSYTYRTSLLNITGIEVRGSVALTKVHLRTTHIYPSPLPSDSPHFILLKSHQTMPNETQLTPVYGILQEKLIPNSEIEISGKVKLLPFSFFVNLQQGRNIWPHPQIPLHISMRYAQGGKFVVLANSWIDDGWGREELIYNHPFIPGSTFTLRISCLDDTFVAQVDNKCLLNFKHRVPYNNIDTILIRGDIYVYNIRVNL